MSLFKKILVGCVSVLLTFSLSGCSFGPDHKTVACGNLNDLLDQYTASPAPDDLSQIASTNSMLSAELAVWKKDGGVADPTFQLLSSYSGKMLLFLAGGTPSSAKDLQDFEESSMKKLLTQCEITTFTVVKPLKIEAGCWDGSPVDAELQQKISGVWTSYKTTYGLSRTTNCANDSSYPWGADFTIHRGLIPNSDPTRANVTYRVVWTESNGYSFSDGTYTHYSCEKATTKSDTTIQLWGDCN